MPFYIQVMFIIIKTIIPKYFNAFFNKLLSLFKLNNNDISRYKIIVAAAIRVCAKTNDDQIY